MPSAVLYLILFLMISNTLLAFLTTAAHGLASCCVAHTLDLYLFALHPFYLQARPSEQLKPLKQG